MVLEARSQRCPIMNPMKLTLKEINQWNADFWADQGPLLKGRMADEAIRETAFEAMATETRKGLPLFYQKSIYEALDDAARARKRFMSQHARKGGLARKTDVLQELIERIVQRNLAITVRELEAKLKRVQGIEAIEDISDRVVSFLNHDGRLKDAKLSGLKDRLSRAKKKIGSR
jgi:hypothetical protein